MAIRFSSFPMVDAYLLEDIGWSADKFTFSYEPENGGAAILEIRHPEDNDEVYYLDDPTGEWEPEHYGLFVTARIHIGYPELLFGPNGVACRDSEIGIGLQWHSKESGQRGSEKGTAFGYYTGRTEAHITLYFEPGQIRGDLFIQPVLYLSKPGKPDINEQFLANQSGLILGQPEFPAIILRFDGTGSMFPVSAEKLGKKNPLWNLFCDWEEPEFEQFDETVAITFNKDHPAYSQLDQSSSKFNPYLLIQILSSAMTQVIIKLQEDGDAWNRMLAGENLTEGSLAQALNYYIVGLEWNTSDIVSLSSSIRSYLERKLFPDENKNA